MAWIDEAKHIFEWHFALNRMLEKDTRGGYISVDVTTVHAHHCPAWRMGTRHGPCVCGAAELWTKWRDKAEAIVRYDP